MMRTSVAHTAVAPTAIYTVIEPEDELPPLPAKAEDTVVSAVEAVAIGAPVGALVGPAAVGTIGAAVGVVDSHTYVFTP
jgi:hypothetical protein